jgi:hypothetical protein
MSTRFSTSTAAAARAQSLMFMVDQKKGRCCSRSRCRHEGIAKARNLTAHLILCPGGSGIKKRITLLVGWAGKSAGSRTARGLVPAIKLAGNACLLASSQAIELV